MSKRPVDLLVDDIREAIKRIEIISKECRSKIFHKTRNLSMQ